MTPADLKAIRERAEKVTPGPWVWRESSDIRDGDMGGFEANGAPVCHFGLAQPYDNAPGTPPSGPDIAFIAAANPATVLALVEEVRRLRKGIDRVFFALRYDSYDQARELAEADGETYTGGVYEDLKALRNGESIG